MDVLAEFDLNAWLSSPNLALTVFLGLTAIVAVIAIIAVQWRRVRVTEAEAGLKLRMIERGYSAEEVQRVLETGLAANQRSRRRRSASAQTCCPSDFAQARSKA